MANSDWYPTRNADLAPWHANFNTEAAASGTTLGLTAGRRLGNAPSSFDKLRMTSSG